MKTLSILPLLAAGLFSAGPVSAALSDQLLAYYNFEETDTAGLANKAPGATTYNATRFGGGTFDASANPSGPGFAGSATFTSALGTSNRSTLLVGKALNLSDDRNDAIVVPLGTSQLGNTFTISAWSFLAPGSATTKTRFHAFESSDTNNYDVSWGTANGSRVNYLSYLATLSSIPSNGLAEGAWHHVAQVFESNGTTTTMTVYVDGVKSGSLSSATTNISFTNLHFGRARAGTDDRDWDGMLDEVGIWNRALTVSEIREVRLRGLAGFGGITDLGLSGKAYVNVDTPDPLLGTTTGTGIYDLNATAAISVVLSPGCMLTSWSGSFTGQPESFNYTVTGPASGTATIAQDLRDPDGDGLSTYQEVTVLHTNPALADTDNDGLPDGAEANQTGTNPLVSDSALVNYVNTNPGSLITGQIELDSAATRDPNTGALVISLDLRRTENGTTWTALPIDGVNTTAIFNNGALEVTLALPAGSPIYTLRGR